MNRPHFAKLAAIVALCAGAASGAETVSIKSREFSIADGFHLESAVAPGLTERPIVADFDQLGNLYVAESSGTNDDVQSQLKQKPHSILRLTDSDNDGVFDQRTVFADRMMFPEGTLWHQGSLYVSAPPLIWKLTDTDLDGVADKREIWFDAKTLTGCANDLHGPYLGPDGWIYWCKGAFAEQTHERPGKTPFVTRAAHIFRRRPEGGPIEPVMTGGMDNPVAVAFSESGERFFTTTFFQHPANGRRDGLVHAIYGGVYGKQHGVIDGHPRTGSLMPVMTHLGAAAPSGLIRLHANSLNLQHHLVSACFNLHNVQAHQLVKNGSTFTTQDTALVSSSDLDFHPTDVLEDADGSLLIVDTGGWYKLCCPTSQLHKPDVLGSIYRLRKKNHSNVKDPRGKELRWSDASSQELVHHLDDRRFAVRQRAMNHIEQRGKAVLPSLRERMQSSTSEAAKTHTVWAACRINHPQARAIVRNGLRDEHAGVRTAAAHAASVWRDNEATHALMSLLSDKEWQVRRVAAEALGRTGDASAVSPLLAALHGTTDRVLLHSLTYALIELEAVAATRAGLASDSVQQIRGALRALHAMPNGKLSTDEICRFLQNDDDAIRELATEIATSRPAGADQYADALHSLPDRAKAAAQIASLFNGLGTATGQVAHVHQLAADWITTQNLATPQRVQLVEQIQFAHFAPPHRKTIIESLLDSRQPPIVAAIVRWLAANPKGNTAFAKRLQTVARSPQVDIATRLVALQCVDAVGDEGIQLLLEQLVADSVQNRSLACSAISGLTLTQDQRLSVAKAIPAVGPLELSRLLAVFESQSDPELGRTVLTGLRRNPAASGLPDNRITSLASQFGDDTAKLAEPLLAQMEIAPAAKAKRLEAILSSLPTGDVRRGQRIFHGKQAACFACHAVGYRGGTAGPDLSRIARIRSRADLLESIVYPSASLVRSYEPVSVITADGRQLLGTIRDQTDEQMVLQMSATEQRTVELAEIESLKPSRISIMPAGLEQQLSQQELADLIAFLESRK